MLFSITTVILAVLTPILSLIFFIIGFEMGMNREKPKIPKPSRKESRIQREEQRKADILWENIARFDGSSTGQREIK